MFGENPDDAMYFASKAILPLLLPPRHLRRIPLREFVARELQLAVELPGYPPSEPPIVRDDLSLRIAETDLQLGRLESQLDDHAPRLRFAEGPGQRGCVVQHPASRTAPGPRRHALKLLPEFGERRTTRMRENRIDAPESLGEPKLPTQVDRCPSERRHRDPLQPHLIRSTRRSRDSTNPGLRLAAASVRAEQTHVGGPPARDRDAPHCRSGEACNGARRPSCAEDRVHAQHVSLPTGRFVPRRARAVDPAPNSHKITALGGHSQLAGVASRGMHHIDEDQVLGIHCLHVTML